MVWVNSFLIKDVKFHYYFIDLRVSSNQAFFRKLSFKTCTEIVLNLRLRVYAQYRND